VIHEGAKRPVTRRASLLAVRCARCTRCGISWHRCAPGAVFRHTEM